LGSRQGFPGLGDGFDGQSYDAVPVTFDPGLKATGIICGGGTNEAVTLCAIFIVTEQPPVPLHAIPHAANVLVPLGVAVNVTPVPVG